MEIPYTVTARPDTGLWNAKIGIWLFLASEVMLFGALFSAYIFLRLGAESDPLYHWPERQLPILPGFINTLVLIGSSVTVVMAWASLKMRNWQKFQIYMGITVFCALIFLALKAVEYNAKFKHYGLRLTDGSLVEGHIHQGGNLRSYSGLESISIPLDDPDFGFLKFLQAGDPKEPGLHGEGEGAAHGEKGESGAAGDEGHDPKPHGDGDKAGEVEPGGISFTTPDGSTISARELKSWFRKHGKELGKAPEGEDPPDSLELKPVGAVSLSAHPKHFRMHNDSGATLKSGAAIKGKLHSDFVDLVVDMIDLRNVADSGDTYSWELLGEEMKSGFIAHRDEKVAEFEEKYPGIKALENRQGMLESLVFKLKKDEAWPQDDHGHKLHPEVVIPREKIAFMSNHTPKYNTFYAIYFTLTGLHGLHVIGGALVLSYFLFRGKELFLKNPEHLANRVEVGGLFWHFVDLVWIFLFPLMYLL